MSDNNPLYILKIGGSVVTYKDRIGLSVRRDLLKKVAHSIKIVQKKKKFDLILIHGAGAAGHQMAHKFGLKDGANNNQKKLLGSLQLRVVNQKLNNAISEIFISEGLPIAPAHTASVIIQRDKKIIKCNFEIIREALRKKCIPLLYGEMVFDENLGMTICSGDVIAPYLAKELKAQKMFFASDIDGIFNKDPYLHKDAELVENISIKELEKSNQLKLTKSHNIDVTEGLLGKIKNINFKKTPSLQSVEIFNGLHEKNYSYIFLEKKFPHSTISL